MMMSWPFLCIGLLLVAFKLVPMWRRRSAALSSLRMVSDYRIQHLRAASEAREQAFKPVVQFLHHGVKISTGAQRYHA